ncbi:MAG: hypothetical protein AAGI52_11655 [Bacteroidota bacterium]
MTRRSLARRAPLVALSLALAASAAAALSGCDAGFDGSPTDNAAPETELAVRSADLREDLGDRRLVSTVDVAWSGTDADGVVLAYEVRAYAVGAGLPEPGPEAGWSRTTRRDSVILLPIPLGFDAADVAVQVRAVDDEDAVDPTPAQTIFPIRNSDPTFRLVDAETPADSTWPVISFSFSAADPDGESNLAGIELALNDTTAGFIRIDPTTTFLTLVAEDPGATVTDARLFLGRGFSNSGVTLPGLSLEAENVLFLRSLDQAGATSRTVRYPALDEDGNPDGSFYIQRVTSNVLLVNDFRASGVEAVMDISREALATHGTATYDEWDLSQTPQNAANPAFSDALPATQDPTLRETLALWDRIYWVTNAVTNSASGNNFPRSAPVLDRFFEGGGRLLLHTPITLPLTAEQGEGNPAIDVLPLSGLVNTEGIRSLRAGRDGPEAVRPAAEVPGTGRTLPELQTSGEVRLYPYNARPDDIILYEISLYAGTNTSATWEGSEVVATIRADRRVALFALPVVNGSALNFVPADGQTEGVADALAVLLDGLDFPTSASLARR